MPPKKQISKKISEKRIGDPVHIKLDKPITLRKYVLGATIDTTKMLKTYAELKQIRETKAGLLEAFHKIYEDIHKLSKKLEREELPSIPLDEHERSEVIEKTEVKEQKPVVKKEGSDEIEQLKAELEAIEKKLSNV